MTPDQRRAAEVVAAILGGEVIDPHRDTCPACGVRTRPSAAGHRTYCRHCSYVALGVHPYTLALAVEFHISVRAVEARLEKYGPPYVNPKAWITPAERVRKRAR